LNSFAHARMSDYVMEARAVLATLWAESSTKVNGKTPNLVEKTHSVTIYRTWLLYIEHDVTQMRRPIGSYWYVCVRPALTLGLERDSRDRARFKPTTLPESIEG
jgi:hypothetical protein